MLRKPLALAAAVFAVALQAPSAHAAPALAGTFDVTDSPGRITAGPDGNVWFTLNGTPDDKQLGKITPAGVVTEYHLPGINLFGLTAGPDGNLWGTATNAVVKIPPSDPTAAHSFPENNIAGGSDIVTGPNGNLWTGGNQGLVIEIPPGNPGQAPAGDQTHTGIVQGNALGITSGPDGNLWVVDNNVTTPDDSAIVRFNSAGVVQGTPAKPGGGLNNGQVAAGPAGQAVFTQPVHTPERVGRVDLSGNIQFTSASDGLGDPTGIVFGNDGAYWITNFGANALRRLTPGGDYTQPINFDPGSGPRYIAKGAGDTLWVGLEGANKVAKITGVSAPPVVTVPPTNPPVPPAKPGVAGIPGKHVFIVSGRFVRIPIACQGSTTCKGIITLRTAKKKHRVKLGSARYSIAAGHTKRVRIKLSKKGSKLIRKGHSLKAIATVGGKTTKVTLKRKR